MIIANNETPLEEIPLHYVDVSINDWFFNAVEYVTDKGIMTSSADNIFSPNNDTNRSMIVAILHRLEGSPAATKTETASTLMTPRLTNGMQTQSLGRQKMV